MAFCIQWSILYALACCVIYMSKWRRSSWSLIVQITTIQSCLIHCIIMLTGNDTSCMGIVRFWPHPPLKKGLSDQESYRYWKQYFFQVAVVTLNAMDHCFTESNGGGDLASLSKAGAIFNKDMLNKIVQAGGDLGGNNSHGSPEIFRLFYT